MASKFRTTINTELYPSINIYIDNGNRITLKQYRSYLYYYDTTNEAFDKGLNTEYKFSAQWRATSHAYTDYKSNDGTKQEYLNRL